MAKSILATLSQQLRKWFLKTGWPWIVKNLWPPIQGHIVAIFVAVIDGLVTRVTEWSEGRTTAKAENAEAKAKAASQKAETANDMAEAEKYRAMAVVWREVADDLRRENDSLKAKIAEATKASAEKFRADLAELDIEGIVEEGDDNTLRIKGSSAKLRLPEPKGK